MFEYIEFIICFGQRVKPEEIRKEKRKVELVYCRQLIFYFAKLLNIGTLKWIGEKYNKDHATVLHSFKTIENYKLTDRNKRAEIEYYESLIRKVEQNIPRIEEIKSMIEPLDKSVSDLEQRCINVSLQIAFMKTEINKLNENTDKGNT